MDISMPREQRKTLETELSRLAVEAVSSLSACDPIALVVCGGYGRGEGAWVNRDGAVSPYNDYDLTIVTSSAVSLSVRRQLRASLTRVVNVPAVDLVFLRSDELARLPPTVFNFDLKHGSSVFWGDRSVLEAVPDFSASHLPLREILVLFLTRNWTFLGGLPREGFVPLGPGERARRFRSQMAKAVLAAGDAHLLLQGRYHTSYRERVARLRASIASPADAKLLSWSLEQKLSPTAQAIRADDLRRLYGAARDYYQDEFCAGLAEYFRIPLGDLSGVPRLYKWHPSTVARRALYRWRRGASFGPILWQHLAEIWLVAAYDKSGRVDPYCVMKAHQALTRARPREALPRLEVDCRPGSRLAAWHRLRNQAAQGRLPS